MQLRSTKTVWYWSLYLGILVLLALANYQAAAQPDASPSQVQSALQTYYMLVISFIQGMILLISVMLGASTIVSEYELGSMELVHSSPATSKYFLVGKYLAALRQIALLLFLSLPITAVGVTLGGATGAQVLEHYFYIFLHAALALAITFPVACASKNVFRTIMSVIGMLVGCYSFMFVVIMASSRTVGGPGSLGPSALFGLIPFAEMLVLGSTIPVFGLAVPASVVVLLISALLIKIFLLGAGSVVSKAGSNETVNLRIHVLLLLGAFSLITMLGSPTMGPGPSMSSGAGTGRWIGAALMMLVIPALVVIGYISAWGRAEERKYLADRLWNWREILGGRPSGNLGYALLCLIVMAGPAIVVLSRITYEWGALALAVVHLVALVLMILGFGWFVGTIVDTAEAARRIVFGGILFVGFICQMIGTMMSLTLSRGTVNRYVDLNFMLAVGKPMEVAVKIVILLVLAFTAYLFGEHRRRTYVEKQYRAAPAA